MQSYNPFRGLHLILKKPSKMNTHLKNKMLFFGVFTFQRYAFNKLIAKKGTRSGGNRNFKI